MPIAERTTVLGGIWAELLADVPANPSLGVGYKDSTLSEAEIQAGWLYGVKVDSAQVNEVLFRLTKLMLLLEIHGTLPYCANTPYVAGSVCLWTDKNIYSAVVDVTGESPTQSPAKWEVLNGLAAHASLTAPHSATSAATASRLIVRDAAGRAKVAAPSASTDIAILSTVTTHAAVAATTGGPGHVELATDAEVQNGADADRAVSPATLATLTSTETRKGLIEIATLAEALLGIDTSRAIVPAVLEALFYNNAGSFSRYQKINGKEVLEYGSGITDGSGDATITFPLAMTSCIVAFACSLGGGSAIIDVVSKGTTSMQVKSYDAAGVAKAAVNFSWLGIGLI